LHVSVADQLETAGSLDIQSLRICNFLLKKSSPNQRMSAIGTLSNYNLQCRRIL
jgi:hypothetical protein